MQRSPSDFVHQCDERLRFGYPLFCGPAHDFREVLHAEGDGRLCPHQAFACYEALRRVAVWGFQVRLVAVGGRDGIAVLQARDHVVRDDFVRHEGAHTLVHHHDAILRRALPLQSLYAVGQRFVARQPRAQRLAELAHLADGGLLLHVGAPFGIAHHPYLVHQRMPLEGLHRVKQDALPVGLDELFGARGVDAQSVSPGQQQSYDGGLLLFHALVRSWL